MFRQISCAIALMVVACSAKPDFCREYDCPDFTVDKNVTSDDYELRCYKTYNWVTTDVKGKWMWNTNKAFMNLFRYISGQNDRKQKIPMTVPVLMVEPSNKGKAKHTMSFFLPSETQTNPPAPLDEKVYLTKIGSMCAYVRSWGGFMSYMTPRSIKRNVHTLEKALKKDGLEDAYIKDYYYTAGYNSPMDFMKRHNEVWFIKK